MILVEKNMGKQGKTERDVPGGILGQGKGRERDKKEAKSRWESVRRRGISEHIVQIMEVPRRHFTRQSDVDDIYIYKWVFFTFHPLKNRKLLLLEYCLQIPDILKNYWSCSN